MKWAKALVGDNLYIANDAVNMEIIKVTTQNTNITRGLQILILSAKIMNKQGPMLYSEFTKTLVLSKCDMV